MGWFTSTCRFCRRRFDPPAWHRPYCSIGCKFAVMDRDRERKRAAEKAQRDARCAAILSTPAPQGGGYRGGGGGMNSGLRDALDNVARATAAVANSSSQRNEATIVQRRQEISTLEGQLKRRRATLAADPHMQQATRRRRASTEAEARATAEAEGARKAADASLASAEARLSGLQTVHIEVAELLEELRDWLAALAEVQAPSEFTVQFDDPSVSKELRHAVAKELARAFGDHPHTHLRMLKRWSAQRQPRRVPGSLSRGRADKLAQRIDALGGNLRLRVVPRSEGTDERGIGGAADPLSFPALREAVQARIEGRKAELAHLDKGPAHAALADLIAMCERLRGTLVRGGDGARSEKQARRLVRALEIPDTERVLLLSSSGQGWTAGWALTDQHVRSVGSSKRPDELTGVLPLSALSGLEVDYNMRFHRIAVGPHVLPVFDSHRAVEAVLRLLSETPTAGGAAETPPAAPSTPSRRSSLPSAAPPRPAPTPAAQNQSAPVDSFYARRGAENRARAQAAEAKAKDAATTYAEQLAAFERVVAIERKKRSMSVKCPRCGRSLPPKQALKHFRSHKP